MENKGMAIEGIELPKDLLMEILSRLPVKTLLRFKSVSKNWHSLLQNPTFISLHHARTRPYDCVCLSQAPVLPNQWSMHLLPDQTSIHDLDLSFTRPHLNKDFIHHGSCKGLMCLSKQSNIVICNPATREYRLLPQPPYHTLQWRTSCLGFTFDSKTNDYEVLRVATLGQNTDHKFQIYGMRADSWKDIIVRVPNHDFHVYCYACPSLDGVFYWCSYDYSTKEHVIDALNKVEGLFKRRSMPGPFSGKNLFLLNDSIALVLPRYVKREGQRFEVWLMDEYRVNECWTLNYTIGPLLGSDIALGFRPNSKVLLIGCHHNRLIVSYNISTWEIKEYKQLCDLPEQRFLTEVFPYSESLMSVKRQVDVA